MKRKSRTRLRRQGIQEANFMELPNEMIRDLDSFCSWRFTNVPELETPVLILLDYSPSNDLASVSIALDYAGGNKCWMSEPKVRQIDGNGPNKHQDYREFDFHGRRFYPYSIQGLTAREFESIESISSICTRLYNHIDWG